MTANLRRRLLGAVSALLVCAVLGHGAPTSVSYDGDGADLQAMIDRLPPGATLSFDPSRSLSLSAPIVLRQPITVQGLSARLPGGLGKTSLIVVAAEGVTLRDLELHGNYFTVDQSGRAPLIRVQRGGFLIERVRLFESSKEGINVTAEDADIVGGIIRDIQAFRIGRDAVGLSGGNAGLKVRDVLIENVTLEKGYLRGAVEVSDGTDNVTVRHIVVTDAIYAVDVQDHRGASAANTRVTLEWIEADRCQYLIRTDNSPRGHRGLTMRNVTGRNIAHPMTISHTRDVVVENVRVALASGEGEGVATEVLRLRNCQDVTVRNLTAGVGSRAAVVTLGYMTERVDYAGPTLVEPGANPMNLSPADRDAFLSEKVAEELRFAIAEDRAISARAAEERSRLRPASQVGGGVN